MKVIPLILALAGTAVLTGCEEGTVVVAHQPAYYGGTAWVGPGYYSGVYYRSESVFYSDHPSYRRHYNGYDHGDYHNKYQNRVVENNTTNQINVNKNVTHKTVYNQAPQTVNHNVKNVNKKQNVNHQQVVEKKKKKKPQQY